MSAAPQMTDNSLPVMVGSNEEIEQTLVSFNQKMLSLLQEIIDLETELLDGKSKQKLLLVEERELIANLREKNNTILSISNQIAAQQEIEKTLNDGNAFRLEGCDTVFESLHEETQRVGNQFSTISHALGIKCHMNQLPHPNENIWKVKFEFPDNETEVVLSFDVPTNRFELCKMSPDHDKFLQLQDFLKQTNDVKGLLCALRILKNIN